MKKYLPIIIAIILILFFAIPVFALSTYLTFQGGTGTTTPSGILYGDNGATASLKTVTIGSNLTFSGGTLSASGSGGTSAFEIATTSDIALSGLSYFTNTSGRTTLGSVATTTVTATSPLSLSNPVVKVGGSNSVLSLDTSGSWTGSAGSVANALTNDATLNGSSFNGSSAISDWGLNLANPNTWTGLQTFTNSSTTVGSFGYASSTLQTIGTLTFGGVTASTWPAFCATITGSADLCDGSDASGAGGSSAYEIATTSDIAASGVAYFTKIGGRTTLGSVATGTISVPTGLTVTADRYALGGSAAIALDTGYVIPLQATLDAKALGATTLTVAGTANQITSSAGAQDLSANRTWTLSIPSQFNIQQASTTVLSAHWLKVGASASTTIDTAGNVSLPVSGTLTVPALTSALTQTDGNGLFAEYGGSGTCTNQAMTLLSALGIATCSSINNAWWSGTDLSVANGGTNASSFSPNSIITSNAAGDTLIATGTQLTVGNLLATSTTATSTFMGNVLISPDNTQYGFATGGQLLELTQNANTVTQSIIVNTNNGGAVTTGYTLGNKNTVNNANPYLGSYYCGTYMGGSGFNTYPGLLPNDGVLVCDQGNIRLASLSSNTASSSITFSVGPGFSTANYDMVFNAQTGGKGYLGIATSTPKAPVHVNATTTPHILLTSQNTEDGWAFRGTGNTFVLATTSPSTFATSTVNALTINTNGFFGLSSSTPGTFLSLGTTNGININPSATSTFGSGINIRSGCFAVNGTCVGGSSSSGIGDPFTHSTIFLPNSATTTKMGIGTTTPYYSLTIASTTGPQLALSDGTAGVASWAMRNAGGNLYFATTTTAGTATTSSSAMSLIGTGKPGIAISSSTPFATLSVNPLPGDFSAQFAVGSSSATSFLIDNSGGIFAKQLRTATNDNAVCVDATTGELETAGNTTCVTSSKFTKDDIRDMTFQQARSIVEQMNAVSFKYKNDGVEKFGFIAEEVEKIEPRLVEHAKKDMVLDGHFFKKGDPISVDYAGYTAVLNKYVQGNNPQASSNWKWYVAIGVFGLWNLALTFKRK